MEKYQLAKNKIELAEKIILQQKVSTQQVSQLCSALLQRDKEKEAAMQKLKEYAKLQFEQAKELREGLSKMFDFQHQNEEKSKKLQEFDNLVAEQEKRLQALLHDSNEVFKPITNSFSMQQRKTREIINGYESICMSNEFSIVRLLELYKSTMREKEQLKVKLDSCTTFLKEREKAIHQLQQELLLREKQHYDQLQSLKSAYQEKSLQSGGGGNNEALQQSLETYKRKLMDQKMDYERELHRLGQEILQLQQQVQQQQ